ncbi:MAG: flippase [Nitrospinae bacterium]|nr:flippase [Nitrospinota bacterium]
MNIFNEKRLISNFLSLSGVQAAKYILPLVTVPYLIRVLGPEKFGLIAFSQAFIQYFVLITDYGFNLSATREISINRDNRTRVSEIFSSIMLIKTGFMLLSLSILCLLVFSIDRFRAERLVYLFTFGIVLGNVLFPVWFFQGMERMKQIAMLNILSMAIFTFSIFIIIRSQGDYIYVPLINSIGSIIAGLISLWIAVRKFGVSIKFPVFTAVKYQLKEGLHIFISTIAISGYTNTRIFAVGLFTSNIITGYYAIAERLMGIIQTFPLASLLQTVYPGLSNLFSENKANAIIIMKRFQKLTTLTYLSGLPAVFIFAPYIVKIVSGFPYEEVILSFRLLLIAIFFINANAFRIQFLLVCGRDDLFAKIHIIMGITGALLSFLFTYSFSYIGTAAAIIIVEFAVLILTLRYYYNEIKGFTCRLGI